MPRNKDNEIEALGEAVELFDSVEDLVYAINTKLKEESQALITRQAIENWLRNGVPAERARIVELATGGAVPREKLRPDLHA